MLEGLIVGYGPFGEYLGLRGARRESRSAAGKSSALRALQDLGGTVAAGDSRLIIPGICIIALFAGCCGEAEGSPAAMANIAEAAAAMATPDAARRRR